MDPIKVIAERLIEQAGLDYVYDMSVAMHQAAVYGEASEAEQAILLLFRTYVDELVDAAGAK